MGYPPDTHTSVGIPWITDPRRREAKQGVDMFRNKTATQHNFATVPRMDIPRSKFPIRQTRKQAFDASDLIVIQCEEVLPGDTWQHEENIMARFATPIAPAIDDIDLETFYFFVPNRLHNQQEWERLITGHPDALTLPGLQAPLNGAVYSYPVGSLLDHFGLPPGDYDQPLQFNALPVWSYFLIYNEWFRDQNLQEPWEYSTTYATIHDTDSITQDGTPWDMMPLRINKRHDKFTSALPWPQKGGAVTLPLGTSAPVVSTGVAPSWTGISGPIVWPGPATQSTLTSTSGADGVDFTAGNAGATETIGFGTITGLETDLSAATAATINALRLAATTQRMLEADARGGTRYVESLLVHFGVRSPDYRLQRPEYLGGSKIAVNVNPVAQTATYDAEPADAASAIGNLGAEMHARGSKRTYTYASTEHGFIIGLAAVRATPVYQQGVRTFWDRIDRYSYYWPIFANLGEAAVPTREVWASPTGTYTNTVWGYQERWAEYRYQPNEITGVLRSTAPQPLDWWHYAEEFATEPALNAEFITDKTKETLARSLATAPSAQWSAQIIMDVLHAGSVARMMPTYSVPGILRF